MCGILDFVLQTSARLLRLLSLLQARATWSGADLAEKLETTTRTLRRDVDRLRVLGYPIESTTGAAGGYRLGPGAALPPLHLDEDEATAVFIGLHTAAGTGVAGADAASIRALSKLESVLPPRMRKRLGMLRTSVLKLADRAPSISLSTVSTLAVACSERLVTRFRYADRGGAVSERTVEPFRLVHVGQRFYLVAWDVSKDAWRTFRLDRMREPETAQTRFKPRRPPGQDLVQYVTESLSLSPYRYRARVLLHASVDEARSHMGAFEGVLEPVSAHRCILQTGASTLDGLAVHIAMLGVDFEIIEPAELGPHVKAIGERLVSGAKGRRKRH